LGRGRSYYQPTQEGREKLLAQRMDEIRRIRADKRKVFRRMTRWLPGGGVRRLTKALQPLNGTSVPSIREAKV
jgi:DNA-binding PadR family transcriptional regulator